MYEYAGKNYTAIELLNYWIAERERIRTKKERGDPKPWTEDVIFQSTYFCSVRREDDKVTRWIRQNWTPDHWGWELYDYSIVLARMLNNIDCLSHLKANCSYPELLGSFEFVQSTLESRAAAGLQVWGGAYVVTSHGLRMPKAAYLCQRVLPAAYTALVGAQTAWGRYMGSGPTLARSHELLMQLEGLGSFMAAQVIADLKNTAGHPLTCAPDWCAWSAGGPGSLRGIRWILGKSSMHTYSIDIEKIESMLTPENTQILQAKGREIHIVNMQDLQNCLCEFDKFMRVMTKTGKSKRKYNGV